MTEKTNAELVAENEHLCERLRASGESVISLMSTLYGIRAAIEPDAPGKLMLSELAGAVNAMRSRLAAAEAENLQKLSELMENDRLQLQDAISPNACRMSWGECIETVEKFRESLHEKDKRIAELEAAPATEKGKP